MSQKNILPKSFYWNAAIRLVLLSVTALAFTWSVQRISQEYYLLSINLGVLFTLQIWLLFRYIFKIDRDLRSFLDSIKTNEFSDKLYDPQKRKGFDRFREVLEQFQEAVEAKSHELHEQEIGYQEILSLSPVGLIILVPSGHVSYCNKAALETLGLKNLHHLDELGDRSVEIKKHLREGNNAQTFQIGPCLFKKTSLLTKSGEKTLLAFENISRPLIEKETESWRKLIRVIRHEIMNSISPIPALSQSLRSDLHEEDLSRLSQGLQTIEQTSVSILDFVNRYRELSALPAPNLRETNLGALLNESVDLFEKKIEEGKVQVEKHLPVQDIKVNADPDLLKRVLTNLIKNALEALEVSENPVLTITAEQEAHQTTIVVQDNGVGIDPEVLDQIFVPFFTTKETGSGIGLSLSRQIMLLHGGSLDVESVVGEGAVFRVMV